MILLSQLLVARTKKILYQVTSEGAYWKIQREISRGQKFYRKMTLKPRVKDDKRCKSRNCSRSRLLTAFTDLPAACADVAAPPCFPLHRSHFPRIILINLILMDFFVCLFHHVLCFKSRAPRNYISLLPRARSRAYFYYTCKHV